MHGKRDNVRRAGPFGCCVRGFFVALALMSGGHITVAQEPGGQAAQTANAGPYPAEIAAWTEAEKARQIAAGKEILAQIAQAIAEQKAQLILPKGDYRFDTPSAKFGGPAQPAFLGISGAKNLVIDGSGSTFWFTEAATAFSISRCNGLVLKNLILDWDPLPFVQGRVVSVNPEKNSFLFQPDPGYDRCVPDLLTEGSPRGAFFDSSAPRFKPGQMGFNVWNFWKNRNSEGQYEVKLRGFYDCTVTDVGAQAGDRFAVFLRKGRAIRVELCEAVTLENITLYASPSLSFVEASGVGPTTYRGCKIVRRPGTNRLISGNADGFNSSLMRHGPVLERCEIDTIGDDFVNVHGVYVRVLAQEDPKTLIVMRHGWGGEEGRPTPLRLYEGKDFRLVGELEATAQSVRYTPQPNPLLGEKHDKWAAAANVEFGKEISVLKLSLNRPVTLKESAILCCENVVGAGAVVRDCLFTGSLARGIRLQSIGAVIENNTISWCAGAGMTFGGQPGFWGEATNSRDVLVRNNQLRDLNVFRQDNPAGIQIVPPGTPGVSEPLQNIQLLGNTICNPGGTGILARATEKLMLKENRIEGYGNEKSRPFRKDEAKVGYGIEVRVCQDAVVEKNEFSSPGVYARGELQRE